MATQVIYYTVQDGGDGSARTRFFESQECIDLLEEHDYSFAMGEGGDSFEVDGTTDLEVETLEQVMAELGLDGEEEDEDESEED